MARRSSFIEELPVLSSFSALVFSFELFPVGFLEGVGARYKKTLAERQGESIGRTGNLRWLSFGGLWCVLILWLTSTALAGQQPRIAGPVEDSARVTVPHSQLTLSGAKDMGPLEEERQFDRMTLVLKRSAEQQQALSALLDGQQSKGSASFHRWLTPEEFGRRFGPAPEDLTKVEIWLEQQGFRVGTVAKSGMWIEFSGSVGQVNKAFQTHIRRFQVEGEMHIANSTDISLPAALAPVVAGVPLHDFFAKPTTVHLRGKDSPAITAPWNNANAMTPGDFAAIYDLSPLYKASLNGTGQTIAIVAEADVELSDVAAFQKIFGLAANPPNMVENGADPGFDHYLGLGAEATIDAEWASAVAPGAIIDMVVTGPQYTSDPAELSAAFAVDQNLAPILSASFGNCEQNLGSVQAALWNQVWEQAAAQGISVFVSSGDAGAAGCASPGGVYGFVPGPVAVNGLASSPYVTAVGGTEFDETVNGGSVSTFWNASNGSNLASATGYIPEEVWNDSCPTTHWCPPPSLTIPTFAAGGGGISTLYPTPAWQTLPVTGLDVLSTYSLPGQAGVTPRGVPDVSLASSALHDGYLFCFTTDTTAPDCELTGGALTQTTFQNEAGGTSFAAPAFAGIMAILDERMKASVTPPNSAGDGRQGLANYVLYPLAAEEQFSACKSSSETDPKAATPAACTFHDITVGNNTPLVGYPFVTGYDATPGYDLASGLGSVDAANLVGNWANAVSGFQGTQTDLMLDPSAASISIAHGQAATLNVTVQRLSSDTTTNTPSGDISVIAQGGTLPNSVGVVAAVPILGSGGSATTGDFTVPNLPGGTYNLVARFPGDSTFAGSVSNPVVVKITPEVSTTTLNVGVSSWQYGRPFGFNASVSGPSGQGTPTGTISFYDNGNLLGKVLLNNFGVAYFDWCPPPNILQIFPNFPPIPCPAVGTHVYSATYGGDTSFTASPTPASATQSYSVQITPGQPLGGINFTATSTPNWTMNEPITAAAVVESGAESALPTGTVQFFLGSTALSQPIALSGNPAGAAVGNLQFPQGADLVTAVYSGDGNYQAGTFATTLNWGIPTGWTAKSTVATVNPGQTATYTLNVSASGYSGAVQISCVPGLDVFNPAPTIVGAVCSLSPASVNLTSGGASVPITVTIATTTESRLVAPPFRVLPYTLPVLALVGWGFRKRRWRSLIGCSLAALVLSGIIASCGGGGGTVIPPVGPPATSGYFSVWSAAAVSSSSTDYTGVKLTLNVNQ
jgi:hypothetical protein